MRLLFFHNGADLYGASRSFLRLNSRLVRDGVVVKAVLPQEGPLLDSLRHAGVDVEVMRPFPVIERSAFKSLGGLVRLIVNTPVSVVQIMRMIGEFRPDAVHSNLSVLFTPALAARLKRVPHIWHIRETYAEFGFFWKLYQRFMAWGADCVVAVSTPIANQFGGTRRKKVKVIYNGFPLSEFEAVPDERVQAFKNRFDLKGELLVGLVGRIKFVRKGQEYLVEAVAQLKDRFPNVKCLLVGSPFPGNESHWTRLQELIRELGVEDRIICTGDVEDIKAAYSAFDISVMASGLPEPFGGVTIESMALGKPVVGTNIGGTVEQIEDGVTGILVPPRDSKALADALATLLGDKSLCEQMGRSGRQRFEDNFEFEPFYEKIRQVYNEVCA
ncbi:glycosyltransferase family 4 protein [Verrucomicrobiota bacterium]